jgi:signal transduction histidine kinase
MNGWFSHRGLSAGAVVAVGTVTAISHFYHAVKESAVHALTLGVIVPLALSGLLVGVGVWLFRGDLRTDATSRVAGWMAAGALIGVVFGYPVIPYQTAHGIGMVDVPFVIGNWITTGALAGFVVGFYDARKDQYRAELEAERAELAARERELKRQNDRLDRFASVISHDLRNPLTVATGRLELLREDREGRREDGKGENADGNQNENQNENEHLEALATALERMHALVDELLTLARQDRSIDEPEPVSLVAAADRCWDVIAAPDSTLVADEELTVMADEGRLRQLLENLFRNAVEHGSTGSRTRSDDAVEHGGSGVTVTVGALPDGSGFYVEDDGRGLPEETESLFEPGRSTSEDGTGLGLAIVAGIVEAHGWEIRASEGSDGGARFEIGGVETAP